MRHPQTYNEADYKLALSHYSKFTLDQLNTEIDKIKGQRAHFSLKAADAFTGRHHYGTKAQLKKCALGHLEKAASYLPFLDAAEGLKAGILDTNPHNRGSYTAMLLSRI